MYPPRWPVVETDMLSLVTFRIECSLTNTQRYIGHSNHQKFLSHFLQAGVKYVRKLNGKLTKSEQNGTNLSASLTLQIAFRLRPCMKLSNKLTENAYPETAVLFSVAIELRKEVVECLDKLLR